MIGLCSPAAVVTRFQEADGKRRERSEAQAIEMNLAS